MINGVPAKVNEKRTPCQNDEESHHFVVTTIEANALRHRVHHIHGVVTNAFAIVAVLKAKVEYYACSNCGQAIQASHLHPVIRTGTASVARRKELDDRLRATKIVLVAHWMERTFIAVAISVARLPQRFEPKIREMTV